MLKKPLQDNVIVKDFIKETELMFELLNGKYIFMFDVGAHMGSSIMSFAENGWNIVDFEPDSSNRERLVRRFKTYQNIYNNNIRKELILGRIPNYLNTRN